MSTWNNLQSKLYIIEIGFIWGKIENITHRIFRNQSK